MHLNPNYENKTDCAIQFKLSQLAISKISISRQLSSVTDLTESFTLLGEDFIEI